MQMWAGSVWVYDNLMIGVGSFAVCDDFDGLCCNGLCLLL